VKASPRFSVHALSCILIIFATDRRVESSGCLKKSYFHKSILNWDRRDIIHKADGEEEEKE
jgi:hypothetical protein